MEEKESSNRNADRRAFLKTAGGTAAITLAVRAQSHASTANRIRVGVIGIGGQGRHHLEQFDRMDQVDLAYVCDVDQTRLAEAARRYPAAVPVTDLRRILDDDSIDAVSIASPDHWHAPAAILACDAGKHVYVEKPCCHNFREGQLLVQAARRNHRIVQHGTQHRSNPFIANAIQMLREGMIGDVLVAKAWNVQRRANIGRVDPTSPPDGFDYDLWVGPAKMVPFKKNCHHYNWRWFYNFGDGDMGNDGVHDLDYARWGLGVEGLPNRVFAVGGKYFFDDDQEFPDTQTVTFEYDGDGTFGSTRQLIFEMRLWSTNYPYNADSGAEFFGTKGRMVLSKRGKLLVYAEREKRIDVQSPQNPVSMQSNHYEDFVNSIRQNQKPRADIQIGFESSALCNLGNLATKLRRSLAIDVDSQTIVEDAEANQGLAREYREGGHWAIPKNA